MITASTLNRISESSYCFWFKSHNMLLIQFETSSNSFPLLRTWNCSISRQGLVNFDFYTYDLIFYEKKSPNLVDLLLRKRFLHLQKIEKEIRDLLNINLYISRLFKTKNNSYFQKFYSMWMLNIDNKIWHLLKGFGNLKVFFWPISKWVA